MDNPYKSPLVPSPPPDRRPQWPLYFWATVGFDGGTVALSVLVLHVDAVERLKGGVPGGVVGAMVGLWYARRR